jgi:uncharacterized membrane protein YidH (DUF202 family)
MTSGASARLDAATAERTEFAWHRTGLAIAGLGLAVVRRDLPGVRTRPAIGALLISMGTLTAVVAALFRLGAARRPISRRTHLRVATAVTLMIGMLAFAVAAATA